MLNKERFIQQTKSSHSVFINSVGGFLYRVCYKKIIYQKENLIPSGMSFLKRNCEKIYTAQKAIQKWLIIPDIKEILTKF